MYQCNKQEFNQHLQSFPSFKKEKSKWGECFEEYYYDEKIIAEVIIGFCDVEYYIDNPNPQTLSFVSDLLKRKEKNIFYTSPDKTYSLGWETLDFSKTF